MLEFFREGGWGMWPILIFGMVTVGAAARFAQKPRLEQLRFLGAMWFTTMVITIHATWTCVAAVLGALGDSERVADDQIVRVMMVGFKESTRPGTLGGLLLVLACLLMTVGVLRASGKAATAKESA